MNKYIILFCFFLFEAGYVTAQNMQVNYTPGIEIDKEIMRCIYRQRLQEDSLNVYSIKETKMLLQVGKSCSKYFGYTSMQEDSVFKHIGTKKVSNAEFSQIMKQADSFSGGYTTLNIFKNYPTGKITTTDRIPFDNYMYEEDVVSPEWKLSTETAEICNYTCKKATTRFRGRNYTAWYTTDIAIDNGPWKFQGLPGLILKVVDDKKQVSFECIGIEKSRQGDHICLSDKDYVKTTKQKFNQTRIKYLDNPGAFALGTGLVKEMTPMATKKRPYNPIELCE